MLERAAASEPLADSAEVFAEFGRRLRAFVSRRVRNRADAEDILQETFLRIHKHLARVRGPERLAAWVFQVARSATADHYRRRGQVHEPLGEQHDRPQADRADATEADFRELADCLTPMTRLLPEPDREAIDLSEIQGLTQREASARAGVTLSGMKSRVQRARWKLKAMLVDCCRIEMDRRGAVVAREPCAGGDGACGPDRARRSLASGVKPRRSRARPRSGCRPAG